MTRYGFYAIPVLDEQARMLGIFTSDDAQAILRQAETADVLALGAVSGTPEDYLSLSVFRLAWKRLPWLFGLFLAETLTGAVLRHYGTAENNELAISPITYFIPLLIGAGGNAGSQVTTMVTRGLAVGEIKVSDFATVLVREFLTAVLVGSVLGATGLLRAKLWGTSWDLCFVVGLALPCIVIWAATIGSLLPIAAKRLGIDPAVMSAPFISTFVDATGLIIYFEIARAILGHLKL
jgi:magnesium transporter